MRSRDKVYLYRQTELRGCYREMAVEWHACVHAWISRVAVPIVKIASLSVSRVTRITGSREIDS